MVDHNSGKEPQKKLSAKIIEKRRRNCFLAACIVPPVLLFTVFYIYPFIYAFYISLFEWSGYSKNMLFVGLKNFYRLAGDGVVLQGLKNNLFFLFWSTLIIFIFSLFFAISITRLRLKFAGFFRIIFFFPNVLSIIVIGVLWMFIYNPNIGLLNFILNSFNLGNLIQDWLGDPNMVMPSLVAPQAWMYIGFYMVLFIGAIQNVPEEYYESATIDGANQFKQQFYITVPLIWGTLRTAFVFFVVNAFARTFALVYVVTRGGPNRASELLTTYLYETAFVHGNFGYGTAIGVVLFVVVAVISFLILKLSRREIVEY
jgi:N-acetylglucosamine transport system permease protein